MDPSLACLSQPSSGRAGARPARKADDLDLADDAIKLCFHEGMERPIQRPNNPEVQETFYDGKKRCHTVKNDALVNAYGEIALLTTTIVKDQLRNWKAGFRDQVMEACCGLHNFRLRFRPWSYFSVIDKIVTRSDDHCYLSKWRTRWRPTGPPCFANGSSVMEVAFSFSLFVPLPIWIPEVVFPSGG